MDRRVGGSGLPPRGEQEPRYTGWPKKFPAPPGCPDAGVPRWGASLLCRPDAILHCAMMSFLFSKPRTRSGTIHVFLPARSQTRTVRSLRATFPLFLEGVSTQSRLPARTSAQRGRTLPNPRRFPRTGEYLADDECAAPETALRWTSPAPADMGGIEFRQEYPGHAAKENAKKVTYRRMKTTSRALPCVPAIKKPPMQIKATIMPMIPVRRSGFLP